jgi:hypothetical protein
MAVLLRERLLAAHYEESVPFSMTYGCFNVIIMFNVLTGVLSYLNMTLCSRVAWG